MLLSHLHLNGYCLEAIELYRQAFNAELAYIEYNSEDDPESGIRHAEIIIHGQKVMLNDRGGNKDMSLESAVQMVVIFDDENALRAAYEIMEQGSVIIDPIGERLFTVCAVNFLDKFGVRWGFMV